MAIINGHTNANYSMYDKGKAYPLSLERPLNTGEYPVKLEFLTLTGSPNSYFTSPNKSRYNALNVFICNADGGAQHQLYTVDSDRYKDRGTTCEDIYKSADISGATDLSGATLALLGTGRDGCYLRNICQIRITTAEAEEEKPEPQMDPDVYQKLLPTITQNDKLIGLARRSKWKVKVKGVDITDEIAKDLISIDVTDNEESVADDLQIKLSDREGVWLQKWLNETVQKGARTKGLKFEVWIGTQTHTGKVSQQKTGTFLLDCLKHKGPPAVATIKCTSLNFQGGIRNDECDKSWENITLRNISKEIATKGGLTLLYCSTTNPLYSRKEQDGETDIAFLIRLCDAAGLSVKIAEKNLIIFERRQFENADAIDVITYKDGSYTTWDLSTGSGDVTYDICEVKYTDPATGKCITGVYKSPEWQEEEDRAAESDDEDDEAVHTKLTITNKKVESQAEAEQLAETELNLHNLYERTVSITVPGNPALMAGLPIRLKKFGYWSGKYMISTCTHSISKSGYTTKLKLRFIG